MRFNGVGIGQQNNKGFVPELLDVWSCLTKPGDQWLRLNGETPLLTGNCAMNRESTPDTIERELKLGLRDCDSISVSSALRNLLGREPTGTTRLLVNRYYDLSGQLHKAGVAIRTRSIIDQHEMTVKIREPDEGGLTQRSEWNFPIDEPALDYALLKTVDLPVAVIKLIDDGALDVVFENAFQRTDWRVSLDGCDVMVSLDLGSVCVAEKTSPVSELELELIAGDIEPLVELSCLLANCLPSFMAVISKAERGDRLIRAADPMQDPPPVSETDWLHWLSRALDPLSGPSPDQAVRALLAIADDEAISTFRASLQDGGLPLGLARWMIRQSLESMDAPH